MYDWFKCRLKCFLTKNSTSLVKGWSRSDSFSKTECWPHATNGTQYSTQKKLRFDFETSGLNYDSAGSPCKKLKIVFLNLTVNYNFEN